MKTRRTRTREQAIARLVSWYWLFTDFLKKQSESEPNAELELELIYVLLASVLYIIAEVASSYIDLAEAQQKLQATSC